MSRRNRNFFKAPPRIDYAKETSIRLKARKNYNNLRIPRLDEQVASLASAVKEMDARPLASILKLGSFQERAVVRESYTNARVTNRNQDLLLPTISQIADRGDVNLITQYENLRVIIPENLAQWGKAIWQENGEVQSFY